MAKITDPVFKNVGGGACSVVGKVLCCEIVVSEFELQQSDSVHFRTFILGKGINPFISSACCGLNSTTPFFYKNGSGIK